MLLKKANTITTPTAYSNGFLHSVKPEVVENLLLQSNQFDTTWTNVSSTETSGQADKDGGTNAWLISKNNSAGRISQSVSSLGINTASVYAKAGTLNWMVVVCGTGAESYFDLSTGSVGGTGSNTIGTNIEEVGNGWYRCSFSYDGTGTVFNIYPADGNFDVSGTSGNIYIQDVQLNKGYSAYPYLETTTEAKPSADFTFTRNSSATRVNELGYIEDVQIIGGELVSNGDFEEIGSELVTNGNFDTDSDWNFIGTANISGGTANFPDTTNSFVIQSIVPFSVKQYKLQYDVTATNGGNLRFSGGSSAFGTYSLPNTLGTHIVYLQSNGTQNGLQFNNAGSFIGSIDNVSVKEVGQNWTFGTGWSMGDGVVVGTSVSAQFMQQPFTFVSGKKYRTTCTITGTDTLTNDLCFRLPYDGKTINIAYATKGQDGVYTHEFVSTGGSNIYFGYIDTGTFTGTVDNVSVKEVTDDTNLPRINYEGFTYAESLGDNLVVNGTFDTDSNWTLETGWSISGGVASCDGTTGNLQQFNVLTTEKYYKAKVTVSNMTTGALSYRLGANASDEVINITDNGTYTAYGIAGSGTVRLRSQSGFDGSVDNVSVQEVIGNLPVPYSGKGHLLLEGQRSNIALSGGPLRYTNATETTNYGVSPSGDNDSIKLESTTATTSYVRTNALSTIGNQCHSIYVKKGIGDYIQLLQSADANHYANYDIVNGVVTASGSATTASIESYGDWYRLIAVYDSVTNTAADARCYLSDSATAGFGSASSAIGNYCEFWGVQVEIGDYATSYIVNTTPNTTVTRLGETCNNATQSFPSEGVLYAEIAALANDGTYREITINDGTSNNVVEIRYTNTDNLFQYVVRSGGSTQMVINQFLDDATEFNKFALRYKDNDFSAWVNGVQVGTDTIGTAPTGLNRLNFDWAGSAYFYGKTKMVATFPYLSNDEMECLTGEGYGTFEALAAAYSYTIK